MRPTRSPTRAPELRALLVDPNRVGSVAHSVRHLLEAAAQVREQLSNDTWLVIGHLESDLAAARPRTFPVAAVTGASRSGHGGDAGAVGSVGGVDGA